MALFKKDKLPDLPSPPSKFNEISKPDFDEDFPRYTPAVNFESEEKNRMQMPQFPKDEEEHETYERKPLFVKIDKYEDALATLNSIKEKLDEANEIISELRQIRKDEDTRLDEWSEHIRGIKEKLMSVDSTLFD